MTYKSFLFYCILFFLFSLLSLSLSLSFSLSLSLTLLLLFSSSPPPLSASYTDIKINTVCVWLVHRMHRHYRMHRPRMYDPPLPTFAPQSSHAILILSVILLLCLPLRMHARTAAAVVASCNRHGWGDESRCELLRERWRAWRIWRRVKDGFRKWRRTWHNKWSIGIFSSASILYFCIFVVLYF